MSLVTVRVALTVAAQFLKHTNKSVIIKMSRYRFSVATTECVRQEVNVIVLKSCVSQYLRNCLSQGVPYGTSRLVVESKASPG